MGSLVGFAWEAGVNDGDGVSVGVLVDLVRVGWALAASVGVRVGTMGSGVGLGTIVGIDVGRLVGSRVGCSSVGGHAAFNRAASMRRAPKTAIKSPPHGRSFFLLTPPPHEQHDHADQHQPRPYA